MRPSLIFKDVWLDCPSHMQKANGSTSITKKIKFFYIISIQTTKIFPKQKNIKHLNVTKRTTVKFSVFSHVEIHLQNTHIKLILFAMVKGSTS